MTIRSNRVCEIVEVVLSELLRIVALDERNRYAWLFGYERNEWLESSPDWNNE